MRHYWGSISPKHGNSTRFWTQSKIHRVHTICEKDVSSSKKIYAFSVQKKTKVARRVHKVIPADLLLEDYKIIHEPHDDPLEICC